MPTGEIGKLVDCVSRMPGVGFRSALRIVVHLLERKHTVMNHLRDALSSVLEKAKKCDICGNIDVKCPCFVCSDQKRDSAVLSVVADIAGLWAIERTGFYHGQYHVLGGKLSAVNGVSPNDIDISGLRKRINEFQSADGKNIQEVILALSSDLDGQTTMFFVKDCLKDLDIKITTLSHGVPVGSDIEYLDDGTLIAALKHRYDI
jgi:recombination protein RecR